VTKQKSEKHVVVDSVKGVHVGSATRRTKEPNGVADAGCVRSATRRTRERGGADGSATRRTKEPHGVVDAAKCTRGRSASKWPLNSCARVGGTEREREGC
jgi:hypothetical protein